MRKLSKRELFFLQVVAEGLLKVTKKGTVYNTVTKRFIGGSSIGSYGWVSSFDHAVGRKRKIYTHRLIWLVFKGFIPKHLQVNHKNGKKTDNRLSNLELVTHAENAKHAARMGLLGDRRGVGNSRAKLSAVEVRRLRSRWAKCKSSMSAYAFSLKHAGKVSHSAVYQIIRGNTYQEVL